MNENIKLFGTIKPLDEYMGENGVEFLINDSGFTMEEIINERNSLQKEFFEKLNNWKVHKEVDQRTDFDVHDEAYKSGYIYVGYVGKNTNPLHYFLLCELEKQLKEQNYNVHIGYGDEYEVDWRTLKIKLSLVD